MTRDNAFMLMQEVLKDLLGDLEADAERAPTNTAFRLTRKRAKQIRETLAVTERAS
jgi:hypothetical protein